MRTGRFAEAVRENINQNKAPKADAHPIRSGASSDTEKPSNPPKEQTHRA